MALEQSTLTTDLTSPSTSEKHSLTTALDRQSGLRGLDAEASGGFADDLDGEPDQLDELGDGDEPPLEHGSFYDSVLEVQ
ncbi:hypothetical protein [Mycolicibacterium helvum]|uniref:Uncharacterized protein n=1 Tax=Mycolicibacterium helvum TaxID=1534349 RepID=A0A7I7T9P2_9MYCO|nr:hypothetical protein [Mycolicibacterium helvum]BBY65710.1 hypothetical protein MHEL_39530 [Mycolicibacterium helvum]